jgi:hypothetical protein
MPLAVLLVALAGALVAPSAAAQYQWRDDNGRMVFSDRPPPSTVPPGNVVRSPARPPAARADAPRRADAEPAASAASDAAGEPASAAGPASVADRELASRKRAAERAEKDKRDAEQRATAERRDRFCEEARTALRTLESGMRVARVNAQGEREFLSEDERERRASELKRDVQQECRAG